ncbi:MAG: glycosyltransferase [Acetobacteraceae bacterium]
MRLAQIMAGAHHGGAELFFERLSIALNRAGVTVLPVIRRDAERAGRLVAVGLRPVALRFGGPLDLLTRPRLARALKAFAPHVAISWMSRATDHMPRGHFVHVARLGGPYPLRHYRHCDHLVGNTEGLVAWFRAHGWPESRTHYLPNFTADHAGVAPATDLPSRRPLLLALGRLHPDKGFDVLIEALARLPAATLLIAGVGPEEASLRKLAAALGVGERVHFLGWRNDAPSLLRAADLFVCPSRREPLGNVVLEAWSAGCPVLASDAAGPSELIAPGSDGLLVPREDSAALAAAAAGLIADPDRAAQLAAAGRARFLAAFTEAPVIARWLRFLQSVRR